MAEFIVYRLISPSGKSYIGLTSRTFKSRLASHISDWKRGSRHCIKLCRAFDKYHPLYYPWAHQFLVKTDNKELAKDTEVSMIKYYNSIKKGYNILPGGSLSRLGIPCSEEHKKKVSEGHKGKIFSEDHKKNISLNHAMNGKHHDEAMKERLSKSLKGNKNSLGCFWDDERRQVRSTTYSGSGNPNFGKKHSDATKEKIRQKHIGMRASDKTKKLLSSQRIGNKYRLGKKFTDEQLAKISKGVRKFYNSKKLASITLTT